MVSDVKLIEDKAVGARMLLEQDLGLWEGDIVFLPSNSEPVLKWKGTPIPRKLYGDALSFFLFAYEKWSSEAVLRLMYNSKTGEWGLLCLPQIVRSGLEASEIDSRNEEQEAMAAASRAEFQGDDWSECGTIHSHCNVGASQSHTDKYGKAGQSGELSMTGVHITLGTINTSEVEVHGRVCLRNVQYDIDWSQWYEDWPESLGNERQSFHLQIPEDFVHSEVPEEWKKMCIEPPAPLRPHGSYYNSNRPWKAGAYAPTNSLYGYAANPENEWWEAYYSKQEQYEYSEVLSSTSDPSNLVRNKSYPVFEPEDGEEVLVPLAAINDIIKLVDEEAYMEPNSNENRKWLIAHLSSLAELYSVVAVPITMNLMSDYVPTDSWAYRKGLNSSFDTVSGRQELLTMVGHLKSIVAATTENAVTIEIPMHLLEDYMDEAEIEDMIAALSGAMETLLATLDEFAEPDSMKEIIDYVEDIVSLADTN